MRNTVRSGQSSIFGICLSDCGITGICKDENSVADAVLNAKLMYCKEQDIPAVISVDKNIRGLTQTELCCVLGNLLDNAIEAELKLSKAQRKIEIKIVMIEEVLDILIRNRIAEPVLQDVQKVKILVQPSRMQKITALA